MHRRDLLKLAPATGLAAATLPLAQAARAETAASLPAAQRFSVGDATVTTLSDGGFGLGVELLTGIETQEAHDILAEHFIDPTTFRAGVNGFLIETGDRKVLVDAGTGGLFGPEINAFLTNLTASGVAPEQIDQVLVSHLHPDHIGGMLDGNGAAVFPNAELVVDEADRAFWNDPANFAAADETSQTFAARAQATLAAYGDRVVTFTGETDVAPNVTSLPLPGHTPGHAGYVVSSGDAALLIWADIVHMAPVQLRRPDVTIAFDVDPAQAAATRAAILDRVSADRMLVAGSHIVFPGLVYIGKDGEGYRAIPERFHYGAAL